MGRKEAGKTPCSIRKILLQELAPFFIKKRIGRWAYVEAPAILNLTEYFSESKLKSRTEDLGKRAKNASNKINKKKGDLRRHLTMQLYI